MTEFWGRMDMMEGSYIMEESENLESYMKAVGYDKLCDVMRFYKIQICRSGIQLKRIVNNKYWSQSNALVRICIHLSFLPPQTVSCRIQVLDFIFWNKYVEPQPFVGYLNCYVCRKHHLHDWALRRHGNCFQLHGTRCRGFVSRTYGQRGWVWFQIITFTKSLVIPLHDSEFVILSQILRDPNSSSTYLSFSQLCRISG